MRYLKIITEKIQQKRSLQHIIFWLAVLLITVPKDLIEKHHSFLFTLVIAICLLVPQILASYFTAYVIILGLIPKKKYIISIFSLIFSAYVFSALSRIIIVYIGEPLVRQPPFEQETLLEIFTDLWHLSRSYLASVYATVFIFLSFKFFLNNKEIKEKELTFKSEKIALELKMLKAQLNPHFLFNTLNNIYLLSLENSPKTPKSIEKLSNILDHILYRCNTDFVPLSSEIELVENYIELEQLRYDDSLQINFNKSIEQDGEIAPLIILTLIENAFKHGSAADGGAPKIDITIENSPTIFNFLITNTVATQEQRIAKTPIGMKNIKKQLDIIYPDRYELQVDSNINFFTVSLSIQNI